MTIKRFITMEPASDDPRLSDLRDIRITTTRDGKLVEVLEQRYSVYGKTPAHADALALRRMCKVFSL